MTEYWARVQPTDYPVMEFEVLADSMTDLELQLIVLPVTVLDRGLREVPENGDNRNGEEKRGAIIRRIS